MSLELYSYWRSSASYRVRIALNLKSLPTIPRRGPEQDGGDQLRRDYSAVNPQSRVPTLVHDGHRFTQSLAIIEYLDEVFPGRALLPRDPWIARACACCRRSSPATSSRCRTPAPALSQGDAQARRCRGAAWLREWITRGLDAFNAHLERDHLSRQVLPRRHADDGRLLPGAADVRRRTLRRGPDALSAART